VAKNFRRQNEPFCRTLSKRLQLITREGQGGSGGHGRGEGAAWTDWDASRIR
jgi:hypothetical protein